ncbi:hypothetical protein CVT24_012742 [Panaeolus cyanescens]|uniref:Uncharacterized protein n=1 Tax=Panaeolus cyanescens TaxID=181874 RepID=A0A409WUI2_9AGAR|nr:hypothetical protein CVT24_012742 [Panaeolus cyanescens]
MNILHCPDSFFTPDFQDVPILSVVGYVDPASSFLSPLGDYHHISLPLQDALWTMSIRPPHMINGYSSSLFRLHFDHTVYCLNTLRNMDNSALPWSILSSSRNEPCIKLVRSLFRPKNSDRLAVPNPYGPWHVNFLHTPSITRRWDPNPMPIYCSDGSLCWPNDWINALGGSLARVTFGIRCVQSPSITLPNHRSQSVTFKAGIIHRVDILHNMYE